MEVYVYLYMKIDVVTDSLNIQLKSFNIKY